MPNFVEIASTMAEISCFLIFQDGGCRHIGFLKFKILEGQTASLCQISSKSFEPRPRYGHFSIFQDGGRRHLGF